MMITEDLSFGVPNGDIQQDIEQSDMRFSTDV